MLCCCQQQGGRGGLRDKPGVGADPYHTCYVLNGAAVVAPERFGLQRVCAVHGVVESKRDALLAALRPT